MNTIVGMGLLGFFLYTGYNASSYTVQTYAQMAISGLGGAYLLISDNVDRVKSLFAKKPAVDKKVEPTEGKVSEGDPIKDFESVSYLRDRCQEIASPEAVDMTVQINTALFKSRIK